MITATAPTAIDKALARAAGYSALAFALAYPEDSNLDELRAIAAEAGDLLRAAPVAGLAAMAAALTKADLEPAYVRLCTLSSSPDCPTFETAYYSSDPQMQTARMGDIAGFYRAFGVETTGSGLRPDDISVELEFMAFLCRKEVHARMSMGAPRVGQTERAQRLFLQEHLGTWGPALGRRIAARAEIPFYRVAGLALGEWLIDDCARLKAAPVEVSGEPVVEPPERSSHGPEFAGPATNIFAFDDIQVL